MKSIYYKSLTGKHSTHWPNFIELQLAGNPSVLSMILLCLAHFLGGTEQCSRVDTLQNCSRMAQQESAISNQCCCSHISALRKNPTFIHAGMYKKTKSRENYNSITRNTVAHCFHKGYRLIVLPVSVWVHWFELEIDKFKGMVYTFQRSSLDQHTPRPHFNLIQKMIYPQHGSQFKNLIALVDSKHSQIT